MEKENKKQSMEIVKFKSGWYKALEHLSSKQRGVVLDYVFDYAFNGEIPWHIDKSNNSRRGQAETIAFLIIKEEIDNELIR